MCSFKKFCLESIHDSKFVYSILVAQRHLSQVLELASIKSAMLVQSALMNLAAGGRRKAGRPASQSSFWDGNRSEPGVSG